ncbi:MAG: hypothetical protein ACRBFS_11880 [Aureispira sp.]
MGTVEELAKKVDKISRAGIDEIEDSLEECLKLAKELLDSKKDTLDELAKEYVIPRAMSTLSTAIEKCSQFRPPLTAQTKGNVGILKEIQECVEKSNRHLIYILCEGEEGIYFLDDSDWWKNKNSIKMKVKGKYIIGLVSGQKIKIKYNTGIFDIYSHSDLEYEVFPEHLESRKDDVLEILRGL